MLYTQKYFSIPKKVKDLQVTYEVSKKKRDSRDWFGVKKLINNGVDGLFKFGKEISRIVECL